MATQSIEGNSIEEIELARKLVMQQPGAAELLEVLGLE